MFNPMTQQVFDAHGSANPSTAYPKRRGCMSCLTSMMFGFDVLIRLFMVAVVCILLVFFLAALVPEPAPRVEKGVALVVAPSGLVVEELSGGPLDRAVAGWLGRAPVETRLRDLLAVIDGAAEDDDIAAMVLDLDRFLGAGPSKLLAVGAALDRFRATGKPLIAKADYYTRSRYQLATHAQEIYLHDMGAVML
jgi:protease-4